MVGWGRVLGQTAWAWVVLGMELAAGDQLGMAEMGKSVVGSGVAASLTLQGLLLRKWTLRTCHPPTRQRKIFKFYD